jgi:hypothetical protein
MGFPLIYAISAFIFNSALRKKPYQKKKEAISASFLNLYVFGR